MKKNKQETKQKIYAALVEIIETEGVQKLGVNAIARKAGVSKVLLYRYYGGLNGLLKEYTSDPAFLPIIEEADLEAQLKEYQKIKDQPEKLHQFRSELSKMTVSKVIENVRNNKALQESIRLQVMESNDLTNHLIQKRNLLFEKFDGIWAEETSFNIHAVTSIISSAIDFMAITMDTNSTLHGSIDLKTDEGWKEIEKAFHYMLDAVHEKIYTDSKS